jgi:hypothetical protein
MKYINKIFVIAFMVMIPAMSFGQYCNYFHEEYCAKSKNKNFKLNGQSKSALFSKGQTSDLSILVYKKMDYRISLCMDENLGSQIGFKIYEMKKVRVQKVIEHKEMEEEMGACSECNGTGELDGEGCWDCNGAGEKPTGNEKEVISKETQVVVEKQKQLLYDNSEDGYANEIEFTVEKSRRLVVEISIPGDGGGGATTKKKSKLMKSSDMGCVGILVEHMMTPVSGF